MPFFNKKTGALAFEGGLTLRAHMTQTELVKALADAGMKAPAPGNGSMLPCPALTGAGGMLAPVCFFREGKLSSVLLTPLSAGQKKTPTVDQQRAFLFASISAQDPSPDTKASCEIRCGFGSLSISTDPRLGGAQMRLAYR